MNLKAFFGGMACLGILMNFVSCGSNHALQNTKARGGINIPQIENLILRHKSEYLSECYDRIVAKKAPQTACESQLFDMAERRHKRNFGERELDNIADEVFFGDYIRADLNSLIRTNKSVGAQVKASFKDQKEMLDYYRQIYSFHARD